VGTWTRPFVLCSLLLFGCSACESSPDAGDLAALTTTSTLDPEHSAWTAILAEHVARDGFDYAALAADSAPLENYLATLQAVTPAELTSWSDEARYAFWINAYNAYTIALIVENHPLDSIRDLDRLFGAQSVFDEAFIPLGALHGDGGPLSLNDIEHGLLRAELKDARVHAAVNCASVSCPPLRNEAFVASRLEEQLDGQMRAFIADRERNRFLVPELRAELSKIFDWFKADFERDATSTRGYLMRYAPESDKMFISNAKLGFAKYDWSLNEARR